MEEKREFDMPLQKQLLWISAKLPPIGAVQYGVGTFGERIQRLPPQKQEGEREFARLLEEERKKFVEEHKKG